MTIIISGVISLWAAIYTFSLAWAVWKQGNRRGGVFVGLLAIAVLVVPMAIQLTIHRITTTQ